MTTLIIILCIIFWLMTAYLSFKGGYKFGVAVGISTAIEVSKGNELDTKKILKMALETLRDR